MRVGVIGLGVLGKPVAARLLARGFEVAVHDVREEPIAELVASGASACASPAEVALRADCIITLVANQSQTEEIVLGPDGILTTLRDETVVVIGFELILG